MKHIKTGLILWSAVLCGSLFAQGQRFVAGPPEENGEVPVGSEDVLIFAQGPPPNAPGLAPAPPQHPGPGNPGIGGNVPMPNHGPGQIPGGGGGGGGTQHRLATVVQTGPGGGRMAMPFEEPAKRTLIVQTTKLDEATRKNIQEDMQIMSLVLDKAAERALDTTEDRRLGIVVKTLPGVHGQNIYMEDYGPLFILNVPIPLTGPKKTEGPEEQQGDSDWEQAKRELSQKRPFGSFEPLKYDSKKVEALKTTLLEALKNATNIRQLKSDQSITVVVSGGGDSRTVITKNVDVKFPKELGKDTIVRNAQEILHHASDQKGMGGQPTTLTIRVKKSDVDAFAKGKIDNGEFTKRATINSN